MADNQRTLRKAVELSGTGLFSGQPCIVRLRPAPPGTGIVFRRLDLPKQPQVRLSAETISTHTRHVAVSGEDVEVESVEHLLSALHVLGVGNLEVEVTAAELPALDGSAKPYLDACRSAGLVEQEEERPVLRIREPVSVTEGDVSVVALPSDRGLRVSFTLAYENGAMPAQHLTLEVSEETYEREIAPARTYCLQSEVEFFRRQGLGGGATPENTLVVGPGGVVRETSLRFPDEFVRHKILDLLGDLAPLGVTLQAHIVAIKSGHAANLRLLRRLQGLRDTEIAGPAHPLLDVHQLLNILPHRYPMLLIDRVIEMEGYQRAVGIKNITINEPYFQGHFPGRPIMPGVLIVEAMAQLAGALLMRRAESQAKIAVLMSLDQVKFRKTVGPGDQLRIEAETVKLKSRTGEVLTRALVGNAPVAEATMKFMLADRE